jgi:hypothetical protein
MGADLWRRGKQASPQDFEETHASGSMRLAAAEFSLAVMAPQLPDFH